MTVRSAIRPGALLGAGNLALIRGGVYIGGGIVPRMVAFLSTSLLRRRFEERGAMSELVKDMPLYVLAEPMLAWLARCTACAR